MKYKELIKYMIVSSVSVLANVAVYFAFERLLHFNYIVCNVIAWIVSVFLAFVMNKEMVFKYKCKDKLDFLKKMTNFYLFRIASLLIDTLVLTICLNIGIIDVISKFISNFSTTFVNFFVR